MRGEDVVVGDLGLPRLNLPFALGLFSPRFLVVILSFHFFKLLVL